MKITNSEIIKSGERELIDTITGDLDWHAIEQVVRKRHRLNIQDDIEYRQGDLIVHNNQVAYRIDFDIKMSLSIIFDRKGNCLSLSTTGDSIDDSEAETTEPSVFDADFLEEIETDGLISEEIPTKPSGGNTSAQRSFPSFSPETVHNPPDIKPEKNPQENISQMASHIAEMISQINADTPYGKQTHEKD